MRAERNSIKTFIRKDLRWQADFLDKYPLLPRQLAVYVETGCDHDCVFCENKRPHTTENLLDTLDKYRAILAANRELKYTDISIAANEALSFPKIVELAALCREHGFSNIEIITSGIRLANPEFTRRLTDAGANSFSISLYAPTPEIHDETTRTPGAFDMAVAGIENLLRAQGIKVHIHTLALSRNTALLDELSSFTQDNFGIPLLVFPVRVKKHLHYSPDEARKIVPTLTQLRKNVRRARLVGFPLCAAAGKHVVARNSAPVIPNAMIYYMLGQRYVHPGACDRCGKREMCIGVVAGYQALHGEEGIAPFTGP